MAMDDRDVAFFFFCGHSDTGLDLVNSADFSLVSVQPYELVYRRSPSIEQSTTLPHILLLYIPGFIPYHNGSNGRIHDPEYVAIHAQPVALSPATP